MEDDFINGIKTSASSRFVGLLCAVLTLLSSCMVALQDSTAPSPKSPAPTAAQAHQAQPLHHQCGLAAGSCLSWERTALDFVWQLASNPALLPLSNCENLVVRFGTEGAILYSKNGDKVESRLYFDPSAVEGGLQDRYAGEMQGLSSAFVAALAARISSQYGSGKELCEILNDGVRDGILASCELVRLGFGNKTDQPEYPLDEIFKSTREKGHDCIADIIIPPATGASDDPAFWCILNETKATMLEDIAYDIVIKGETAALWRVPLSRFGKLKTVDRAEIESFRSIRNLMREYINSSTSTRPLSIAVFGSPGSGKSFGVTEVAQSITFIVGKFQESDTSNYLKKVM